MIYDYQIKNINGEDVLYLYFDIEDDFAFKNTLKDIKDIISKYIKDKNILVKCSLAFIVVGSSVVGSININNDYPKTINVQAQSYLSQNKTYITFYNNGVLVNIELEEYVLGVVAAEMPASFHIEALKAQAILARTYALKAKKNNIILSNSSNSQNYKSNKELKRMWGKSYNTYYNKLKKAVNSTKGMYLTYNGTIIEALYHSTSNGQTEDAEFVWGNKVPYLVSVNSKYDKLNKGYKVTKTITYKELSKILGYKVTKNTSIKIISKTKSNRIDKIKIKGHTYKGTEIRTLLNLRSADFKITKNKKGITIKTYGYGHGVGMSQYGALGYAKNGYKYDKILKHYYKGVQISI